MGEVASKYAVAAQELKTHLNAQPGIENGISVPDFMDVVESLHSGLVLDYKLVQPVGLKGGCLLLVLDQEHPVATEPLPEDNWLGQTVGDQLQVIVDMVSETLKLVGGVSAEMVSAEEFTARKNELHQIWAAQNWGVQGD